MADFHSLRVTYISALVGSGASVKEAQLLARHSDPGLTIQIYTRTSLLDLGRVLNSMPETPVTTPEKSHRTRGTCV
ncbi:MAG: hypothetical protein DWP92_05190 [Armatimonadetes bacterium]|nr:MAG: hypothetical protein DWP92_05190 [Armatimonadota bacterium]